MSQGKGLDGEMSRLHLDSCHKSMLYLSMLPQYHSEGQWKYTQMVWFWRVGVRTTRAGPHRSNSERRPSVFPSTIWMRLEQPLGCYNQQLMSLMAGELMDQNRSRIEPGVDTAWINRTSGHLSRCLWFKTRPTCVRRGGERIINFCFLVLCEIVCV